MNTQKIISSAVFLMLAACGGGGDGGDNSSLLVTRDFDELIDQTDAFFVAAEDAELTDDAAVPVTGQATYDGSLMLFVYNEADDAVLGTVEMIADFADNTISGRAGGFYNSSEESMSGSVTFSNGEIIREDGVFFATDVEGSVEFDSGRMAVDGESFGYLLGDEGELMFAGIEGTATNSAGDESFLEGFIAAEQ